MSKEPSESSPYPYDHFMVLLTGPQLQAFGAYVCCCAGLEYQAAGLVRELCDLRPEFEDPVHVFTTGMTLRAKLEIAQKIAYRAFPKNDDFLNDLNKYCVDVTAATALRNDIVHSVWLSDTTLSESDPIAVAELNKRHRKGWVNVQHELTTATLEEAMQNIWRIREDFARFYPLIQTLHEQRRLAFQPKSS